MANSKLSDFLCVQQGTGTAEVIHTGIHTVHSEYCTMNFAV